MEENFKLTKKLNHIAFIMDGNGRWAKKRGLSRTKGHKEGCKRIGEIFSACRKYGIRVFTIYAFSTENWNRPKKEIDYLFNYLESFFNENIERFVKEGVRVQHMGDPSKLPIKTQKILKEAIERTKHNDKNVFNICLNYGSRQEIVSSVKKIIKDVKDKKINVDDIDEHLFYQYLDSGNLEEVDLLIRTSGEQRLSNFLLYQLAYAEFIFTPTYWPDFNEEELVKCLKEYCSRERRFGAIKED